MFGKALYYPTIDIKDEDWLKNAYLFWDGICTIVPEKLEGEAYNTNTTQFLKDVGFLEPIMVSPNSPAVRDMASVVRTFAQTEEGMAYLRERLPENIESNPRSDERSYFFLHHAKLPYVVQNLIADKIGEDGWARVSENFANFYMTLLANKLARQNSLSLLTSDSNHDKLSTCFSIDTYMRSLTQEQGNVESIGQSLLIKLIVDGIKIDPLTSFEKLQEFKEKHFEELLNFRNGFEELAKMEIPSDITIDGLKQKVQDIYNNKFILDSRNLQHALQGFGINFLIGGVATFALSDFSTCFNEVLSNLPHPTHLAIGAGAVLTYKCYLTIKKNQETRRSHLMSYVLSIERELGRR